MDGIKGGHSSGEVSLKDGIAFLYPFIEEVNETDTALAFRLAADYATRKVEDDEYFEAYRKLSPTAKMLYEILHILMTIGE